VALYTNNHAQRDNGVMRNDLVILIYICTVSFIFVVTYKVGIIET